MRQESGDEARGRPITSAEEDGNETEEPAVATASRTTKPRRTVKPAEKDKDIPDLAEPEVAADAETDAQTTYVEIIDISRG